MFGCLPIRILLGPSGSEESSDQQESNSQVAVEGGNGGTAGVGANNAGTVSGGSGAAVENSSDVHITTSDPEVIEEALGVVGNVANDAIVGSQLTTGEAAGRFANRGGRHRLRLADGRLRRTQHRHVVFAVSRRPAN